MKIAVLSGKGGTGKTFVSVNLSSAMEHSVYVDCDVEEPNGRLFFKPKIDFEKEVKIRIPEFHIQKCIGCKQCVDFCAFHALAFTQGKPMLFPEVCHSCGGCKLVCKHNAITENDKVIGTIFSGKSEDVAFLSGQMNLGEVSGIPIIKELLSSIPGEKDAVIDCPPGSGCMVMESIQQADYCILVAEPTLFGKENLKMVFELTQMFEKRVGVVLNKCTEADNPSEDYCNLNKIEIIGRIPFDKEFGRKNSNGEIIVKQNNILRNQFVELYSDIRKRVYG